VESEMSDVYSELKEFNPKAMIIDDFEEAYLGYSSDGKAIYDFYTMLDLVIDGIYEDAEEEITEDQAYSEAYSHLDYNVINAYVGEHTPIIMYKELHE
jgi:hypothetical protein